MTEFVLEKVENIEGKLENAGFQHFPLFLNVFKTHLRVVRKPDFIL